MTGAVFIVGNSRSGTTMMARILGRHSVAFSFRELHYFDELVSLDQAGERKILEREKAESLVSKLISIQREGFFAKHQPSRHILEARAILDQCGGMTDAAVIFMAFLFHEASLHGKKVAVDQTPGNLFYLPEIFEAYPFAKVINMVRDPRDVLLSQKNKWRRRFLGDSKMPLGETMRAWVNYHPITISRLWKGAAETAMEFKNHKRLLTVRFEDVLSRPDKEVERVCRFLGLAFEPLMLDIPQAGSSLGHDDISRRGINRDRIGQWKRGRLNATEISICQRITRQQMNKFGYEVEDMVASPYLTALYCSTFPIKIMSALLLNLRRVRNLPHTIGRRLAGATR